MKNSTLFRKVIILMIPFFSAFSIISKTQVNNIINSGAGPYATIQAAINDPATVAGDIIEVSPGTYIENVIINKNNIVLRSTGGKAVTTIQGITTANAGAVMLANGTNDVIIGQPGKGFTIIGFDGSGPGESAAIYLLGAHTNITIEGNEIMANGDHGLLSLFNSAIDGIYIRGNEFTGLTFLGSTPGGCGFATQFDPGNNVPRQLVTMGGGAGVTNSKNVYFLNNIVTGTAGGASTEAGCTTTGQGNNLVTIDVIGCTVSGNTFNGTTSRFGNSLRTRGPASSIYCNTFYTTGLGASCGNIFFGGPGPLVGASPGTAAGVASQNLFPNGGAYLTPDNAASYVIFLDVAQATAAAALIGAGQAAIAANAALNCPVLNVNSGMTFPTIQSAINSPFTLNGHTIQVSAGTYNEQVDVNKSVTIRGNNYGTAGFAARGAESIVDGDNGLHSCFLVNANDVVIDGFTIQRGSSDGPGVDYESGVWFNTSQSGAQLINNIITDCQKGVYPNCSGPSYIKHNLFDGNNRPGPAGGVAIYTFSSDGLTIEDNEIKGQTTNAAVIFDGNGTHSNLIFTKNYLHDNDPGSSGVYCFKINGGSFTQNRITGLATRHLKFAGDNANIDVLNNSFENNGVGIKVTTDAYSDNSDIRIHDNSFTGITVFAIENENPFALDATCNWYGSTNSAIVASKIAGSVTYLPYLLNGTDNSTDIGFQPVPNSCTGGIPKLTTSINGIIVNANNDGSDDNGSFTACNTTNNILFNSFTDQNGLADPLLKVYQTFTVSNVTVPFCNNCSATMAAFAGAMGTAALVDPALPGTLTMSFRSWVDANNDGVVDPSEFASDWIVYTITITPYPTVSFDIGGSSVASINNGLADASESATVAVCNGGTYTVSNLINSSTSNRYTVNVTPSGGVLLFNGSPAGNGDISAAQFSAVVGPVYTITLSNPVVGGSLVQVITPYADANGNGSYDAGDCAGDPITINYTAYPIPNAVAIPSSQTSASGAAITTIVLSGNVSGTIYNWTRDNTATVTGIAASGSGNISGVLTNTTLVPVTVTFTITPTANGCPGTPVNATVTVGPVAPACVITCPPNKTVNNSWGKCGAIVTYPAATTTGSCGPLVYSKPSGSFFSVGTTTVTVSSASTGASCSFTITVLDKEKPDIICPPDITVTAATNTCSKVVSFTVTVKDNCPGVTITTVPAAGTVFPVGTTTVTATATDASGNQTTTTFKVKVKETQPPVININTAANPIVLLWPANGSYQTINVSQLVNSVSDNCSTIPVSSVKITKVTSDEAENASGDADGNTHKDIKIADNCKSVDLRRERKNTGNGRGYTIYLSVTDASGNTGTSTFKVIAPVTQTGTTVVTDATAYTVSSNCSSNNHNRSGAEVTSEELIVKNEIPEGFIMEQNYPNPFSAVTTIRYALPVEAKVSLGVYNQLGQRVAQLTEGRMSAGYHQARFDATKLAAGIYLYRLLAVDADGKPFVITKKMVVAK